MTDFILQSMVDLATKIVVNETPVMIGPHSSVGRKLGGYSWPLQYDVFVCLTTNGQKAPQSGYYIE